eukprot:2887205-Prymnesium_polylepis.1
MTTRSATGRRRRGRQVRSGTEAASAASPSSTSQSSQQQLEHTLRRYGRIVSQCSANQQESQNKYSPKTEETLKCGLVPPVCVGKRYLVPATAPRGA